jgi:hypothetical protein
MNDNFGDNPRFHDFNPESDPEMPRPVEIGGGLAYCFVCNLEFLYSMRGIKKYCPNCLRCPK